MSDYYYIIITDHLQYYNYQPFIVITDRLNSILCTIVYTYKDFSFSILNKSNTYICS